VALACVTLALAGCGATPPQAPKAQAGKVSTSLTDIITACGESYQEQAFTPHPDLRALEAAASNNANTLARIAIRHPEWIYQGQTLRQIVTLSMHYLHTCGLLEAEKVLRHDVSGA
jgi:hypothetical protein